ncbi:helix-turn-helix transcriptional regulator [Streptantibioticus parmotrematis]|uniref:helix-turn-helix domain-containing protein n=1 Tax=Streptantibioticus parmotrematis TaxID=2873249 RepID=UPI00340C7902
MSAAASSGVGRRIAYYRRLNRLTQEELARSANVHVGTLRKIERGTRGVGDAVLDGVAAALGIDPSRLIAPRADQRQVAGLPSRTFRGHRHVRRARGTPGTLTWGAAQGG